MNTSKRTVVWYHESCLDGTCAAWVASQYLSEDTEYIAQNYGKPITKAKCITSPEDMANTDLYILDWCPESMEKLQECCEKFHSVTLIDHHESAIKRVQKWYEEMFNSLTKKPENFTQFLALQNEWSGAMGTAIWFHTNFDKYVIEDGDGFVQHWLVQAIDDRDRWQFKLPYTREINAGLFHMGFDLEVWRKQPFSEHQRLGLRDNGIVFLTAKQIEIDLIISSGLQFIDDANDNAFAAIINAPYHLASEMGNQIIQDHKFRIAIVWNIDKDYKTCFSLRSTPENLHALNCAEIASLLGGGGHVNAAGVKMAMPYQMAREKLEEVLASYE